MKSETYLECPYIGCICQWKMTGEHIKGYSYLNGVCYLLKGFESEKCQYKKTTNKLMKKEVLQDD